MNLFILDTDPIIAARNNCDKHVCKIILEAAQMLSLAHIVNGSTDPALWNAKTHRNNHVSKWVRETIANYEWTAKHGLALCSEYEDRYGKVHDTKGLLLHLATNVPNLPRGGMTPFRQAVAEDCYNTDPVTAYYLYYVKYKYNSPNGVLDWSQGGTLQ